MAENENEQEPEFNTDAGKVFSRDPGKSDIIQALAERLGCTVDEACERLGLKRPDPTDSIDAADRYGVDVVGCDEDSNDEQSCPGVFVHWLPDPKSSEDDEGDEDDEDIEDEDNEDYDDDDLVGGDGLSGHGNRFEVNDESLYWAKYGKDNTELTVSFMVDDFKIEDEAYFEIEAKINNVTWKKNGKIDNFTLVSIGTSDLTDIAKDMGPDSQETIDRLCEDAKKLLNRLELNHGQSYSDDPVCI